MNDWIKRIVQPPSDDADQAKKLERPAKKWRNLWLIPPGCKLRRPGGGRYPVGEYLGEDVFATAEIAETVAMEKIMGARQIFWQPGEELTLDEQRAIYLGPRAVK